MANKIDEIRKRLKDATPGPWEYVPADDCDDWQLYNGEFTFIKQDDSGVPVSTEDGEFIANAPTDIDFLLGEVSRLKAEIVKDNEEYAKRDKRAGEECGRLKLLAESYRSTLAEIAALTSENGCVEMAADMAQSVLNEDER